MLLRHSGWSQAAARSRAANPIVSIALLSAVDHTKPATAQQYRLSVPLLLRLLVVVVVAAAAAIPSLLL
eukprot:6223562-Amphidinium_carterae.1